MPVRRKEWWRILSTPESLYVSWYERANMKWRLDTRRLLKLTDTYVPAIVHRKYHALVDRANDTMRRRRERSRKLARSDTKYLSDL